MTNERKQEIDDVFPNLRREGEYQETSEETDKYNCIAWALYDVKQWWWPTPRYGCYWLPGLPRDNKRETLIRTFEIHGYIKCDSAEPEKGYEKVALYEIHPGSGVEHAARQLQSGEWTSKLGEWEDIRHKTAQSVECDDYGKVVQILKRRRKEWDDDNKTDEAGA
jgi:hypothetical protein